MNPQELAETLGRTPPARIALIDIAASIIRPDGTIDQETAEKQAVLIEDARCAASAYAQQTSALKNALRWKLFSARRY